ncbi:putative RNA-directed DNA polymerase [Tanacetum coccineum]
MVRHETVKLQMEYWTTYIEYGWSDLRPVAHDGMAVVAQNTNNTTIRSEGKLAHLEHPMTPLHYPVVSQTERDAYKALNDAQNEVACHMLSSLQTGGWSVSKLLSLEDEELPGHFGTPRLCNAKRRLKPPIVLAMREGKIQKYEKKLQGAKDKAKGKNKLAYAPKTKIPLPPKRENLAKDFICHHCKEVGHRRRNCPSYHAELKKRKNASEASNSGIFTIELYVISNNTWVYDTSCGTHICNTSQGLRRSRKLKHGALSLYMGNGMRAAVEAITNFDLIIPSGLITVLDNCHFAPTVTRGVVSISCLVKNGYTHTFMNYGISVSKDNVFYFNSIPHDDIYEIDMHNLYPNISSSYNIRNKRAKHGLDSYYLWHCRLRHINKKHMDMLQCDRLLQPTHDESHEKCKSCISGKMARKPFPHQGANYFITFTDDVSRYGFVYLMKHKYEVFETFKVFQNEVEKQFGKKIMAIRSDRGGEYLSHEFVNHMKSYGIVYQLTPPYTPQHNGVSERRNRTLLDMVRSMMNLTTLPKSFWGYALKTAARILNMVPTKKVDRMPYEIWHGKAPNLSYLRETMGYCFYYPLENKIFVSRNIEFFENSFMIQEASGSHGILKMSGSDKGLEIIQEEDTQPSENTRKEHDKVAPIEVEPQNVREILMNLLNYKAALADPEYDKWLEAMNTEMQSMKDNQVWIQVELPPNGRTVGSKWLFKKKTDMDGNVHTFKARLVAKGYTQTYGVDYGETFSPVAYIRAIRTLLAIAAFYDYEIWHMDVKTTFLNGHLSEDLYMVQPEGFVDPKHPNKVCKLQHSIYGLKQASRNLGEATYILGIKIIRDRSKWLIALSQSAYLEKILKKFRMENSKKGYTLMMEKPDYRKSQGAKTPTKVKRMQRVPYASAIGSIMNTKDMVLVYGAKPEDKLKVSCYADASFQTDKDDTKSPTGYVFVLNGGVVDWKSAKQSNTTMSSIESKYIDVAEASMEAVWIRKFIDGLGGVMPSNKRPMEMLCDNEPTLAIARDPKILKGARHFQRKYHYIREVIQ